MRIGLIADVHANLPALEAVVERLEAEEVDVYACAGDLVGYGPFPDECVALVRGLRGIACVAGNHDLIALGRLSTERCIPLARRTLDWTASVMREDTREWLGALPLDARLPGGVVIAHGSLGDPEEYVRTPEQTRAEAAKLGDGERVLVLGHTHVPMLDGAPAAPGERRWPAGETVVVNPGAVGQSRTRDPRALAAILDPEARTIRFLAVDYDGARTRAALRERGLPENACHLPPAPLPRRLAGRAARALRLR